jgi:hypothetical protein
MNEAIGYALKMDNKYFDVYDITMVKKLNADCVLRSKAEANQVKNDNSNPEWESDVVLKTAKIVKIKMIDESIP